MTVDRALAALGLGGATRRPLTPGLSSDAWLVEHDRTRAVLRIARAADEPYEREHAVLAALAGAPVPTPLAGSWEIADWRGPPFSLTSYVDGAALDPADAIEVADELAAFLATLHDVSPPPGMPTAVDRFGVIDGGPRVLVHSDLHEGNILRADEGISVIDFGCAFVGSRLWDYAALAFFLGWPLVEQLLTPSDLDEAARYALRFARYRSGFADDREHAAAFAAATAARLS